MTPEKKTDAPKWIRTWSGGRVRLTKDGREIFVIERRAGGTRRIIALDVTNEPDAEVELRLFYRDPLNYKSKRQHHRDVVREDGGRSLRLDPDTLEEFLGDANQRVERGELSSGYVSSTLEPYLAQWALELGGAEFKKITLMDLKAVQKRWTTARHKRVVALKAFTAWAREAGKLKRQHDPTLDLKVPAVKTRPVEERAFTKEQIEKCYAGLRDYVFAVGYGGDEADAPKDAARKTVNLQPVRDVFFLRAMCGMHHTEIERLASGDGKIRLLKGQGEIAATLRFKHKSGGEHVVAIGAQALSAAQRLQELGQAPNRVTTGRAMQRVVEQHPDLDGFAMENLRHSFVTLATAGRVVTAKSGGVPLELIAQVAGHANTKTTRRHYLGSHIPPMIVIPLVLKNADDPN